MNLAPELLAPARTLEMERAAYWQGRERLRRDRLRLAADTWNLYLRWAVGQQGGPLPVFFEWLTEGRQEGTGNQYAYADSGRAQLAGYTGKHSDLQLIGRALRTGWTRAQIDALSLTDLREALRVQKREEAEAAQAVLSPLQDHARTLIADADPQAPTGITERNALALLVLDVLPPAILRAAVRAAQGEDATDLSNLGAAVQPPTFGEWAKLRGTCWVCQQTSSGGEIFDLHHVAYGGFDARTEAHAEIVVPVHRRCHVPQPFSAAQTAHSRAHSMHSDPLRLVALLDYLQTEHGRYERWIRGVS